jgi:peptidase M48-like protein
MSPRSLPGQSVSVGFMVVTVLSLALRADAAPPSPVSGIPDAIGVRALQYFASTGPRSWNESLKRLRPAAVSAARRARSLAMVRKEDMIEPSFARQAKLDALRPVLEYLERDTVVEIKILRLKLAWAGFLEGAAILVSEEAIDLLTAEELQAVVAHELAHEYFSDEYEAARKNRRYDTVREIELRCDAISIVTMKGLRLDSDALLSGVARLTAFNERRGFPNNPNLVPSAEERTNFSHAVVELVSN